MEACIEEICQWMHVNQFKLNDSKTEFLTLGTKYNLSQLENVSLKIGDEDILSTSSARNMMQQWI